MKYEILNKDYSDDIVRLRKQYISEILETCLYGYEMFSSFLAGHLHFSKEIEEEFGEFILRVKTVFPSSKVEDISSEIMYQIIEKESNWAMAWGAYAETNKLREEYKKSKRELKNRLAIAG